MSHISPYRHACCRHDKEKYTENVRTCSTTQVNREYLFAKLDESVVLLLVVWAHPPTTALI